MSLVSYINICKEIRDILNYLRNNSENLTIEEIKKLYIRYLYLLTRVGISNTKYNDFVSKYNTLVSTINTIIEDNVATAEEKVRYKTAMNNYNTVIQVVYPNCGVPLLLKGNSKGNLIGIGVKY